MKKKIILLFIFVVFFINQSFAEDVFSEDDGAYWYLKLCEYLPKGVETSTSLKDFNDSEIATVENFNIEYLNNVINYFNKARESEKCSLFDKEQNRNYLHYSYCRADEIKEGFKAANQLAWYCVSINKPELASFIWESILDFAKKSSENNIISNRIQSAEIVSLVIRSLDNYFDNGASDDFKNLFLNYLKEWPKEIFDLKNTIEVTYDFSKKEIEIRESDMNKLAQWFSWARNVQCFGQLNNVTKALNIHSGFATKDKDDILVFNNTSDIGETNYCNLGWEQIVEELKNANLLNAKRQFDCPNKGKRTVKILNKLYKNYNTNKYYKGLEYVINCDCVNKLDYDEDSEIMKFAGSYKENYWEKAKSDFFKFYNKALETASSTDNTDMEIPLSMLNENLFLMHLGFSYDDLKYQFSNANKKIKDFIQKQDK